MSQFNISVNACIRDMRVSDLVRPLGIAQAVFSWKTEADNIGWMQSAYRIVVRQEENMVWDSGKVWDGSSVGIVCGVPLSPCTAYTWQVTVWDAEGTETVSEREPFETGLPTENPFGKAKWISYTERPLCTDTVYTIDFDFCILESSQGFCFGMEKSNSFFMWQINALSPDGKVLLRPHIRKNGMWSAYPGGPRDIPAVDITAAIGCGAADLIGKTLHERIEVNGSIVKTYLGKDIHSLTLASTFAHTEPIPLKNFGFRQHGGHPNEAAMYGNIVIRGADGSIVHKTDFTDGTIPFSNASRCRLTNGMLQIGRVGGSGELICYYTKEDRLPGFRKKVEVSKELACARLYTSGLGVYESYLNGVRVGRTAKDGTVTYDELKPGFTEMGLRKFYNTYDVTAMLTAGENVLSAVVSHGWWSDAAAANYGGRDAYIAKLCLIYADGTVEEINTDTTWKYAKASAVANADIFSGESYDARVDESWKCPGFDDSSWENADISEEFTGVLCPWQGSPITTRTDLERNAQSVTIYQGAVGADDRQHGTIHVLRTCGDEAFTLNPGETALIDFGQNFAGRECFSAEGAEGTTIVIRHGEMLNDQNGLFSRGCDGPEGSIYNANYRSAEATTRYIMNGRGIETYHPTFTFYGFRYIEITADKTISVHSVKGQVVTSVEKETGFLETSDRDVNRLIRNIRWGQYSNYLSIPTDCPQRDERQGWTADTQVFTKAGCYLAFSKSFLTKFTADMRDSQRSDGAYPGTAPSGCYHGAGFGGTGWADAGIIIPYQLYRFYGDKSVIRENWDAMQLYIDGYLASTEKHGPCKIWGDWLAYESNDHEIQEMLGVAFYAWDARMMAEMADALGLADEVTKYQKLYEEEKAFFQSLYVKEDGTLKRGEQSVCVYALFLDLLPNDASANAVIAQLTSNIARNGSKLQTGFLGTAILLPTLTKIGRSDLAYSLLLQHDNPSWLYSVDQGATTIWERWNSYTIKNGFGDVGMNSFNHYAYGAVAAWMFDTMAGISAGEPGFKRIILAPQPDERLAVKASYDAAYGIITAESTFTDNAWIYTCSIPANTTANIRIPTAVPASCTVNGKAPAELTLAHDGIVFVGMEDGNAVFEAVSRKYTIQIVR